MINASYKLVKRTQPRERDKNIPVGWISSRESKRIHKREREREREREVE